MSVPASIQRFLASHRYEWDVLAHPHASTPLAAAAAAYVEPEAMVQSRVLRDVRGLVVAVFPATHELDVQALNRELDRHLSPLHERQAQALFPDAERGIIPALSGAYGVKAIIDEHVAEEVYFRASATHLIRMARRDLIAIQHAWRGSRLSRPGKNADHDAREAALDPRARMHERIRQVEQLPAMPEMGERILQLRANPYADSADLASVVELDPSLSAQVVRYARSPFFAYQGEVASIQDAVSRVLGYEMTLNIVLGIAMGQAFVIPRTGPLGLRSFWRHSVYCASLCQLLAKSLPQAVRPKPGLAYLAGMLHNFGFLLLGELFKPEFYWLNKQIDRHPDESVHDVEARLLGVHHTELGAWLMESWNMPGEVIAAVREHHNPDYDGVHAIFPALVLTANSLLARLSLGDAESGDLPPQTLRLLSISEAQAAQLLESVQLGAPGLDWIAEQLAA